MAVRVVNSIGLPPLLHNLHSKLYQKIEYTKNWNCSWKKYLLLQKLPYQFSKPTAITAKYTEHLNSLMRNIADADKVQSSNHQSSWFWSWFGKVKNS